MALKRKKLYESQINKLQSTEFTLSSQILSIESASVNIALMSSMKASVGTMKSLSSN